MDPQRCSSRLITHAKLVVGVDYGTTYSGISFAMSNAENLEDIKSWTNYPGSHEHGGGHYQKAPSWVALAEDNPDDLNENAWGYLVPPGVTTYAWTKLLLDESAVPSEYDDPDLQKVVGNGLSMLPSKRPAKELVTEYLRGMHKMFEKTTNDVYGADNMQVTPLDIWLTVPATWTERAKKLTVAAARDAGFGSKIIDKISLVSEPEAAALCALNIKVREVHDLVKPGTGVLVCDCGGGTVDMTTYEIERTSPDLRLKEVCVGVTGKCGGTYVDRNLHQLLTRWFGESYTTLEPLDTGPGSRLMDDFEGAKRDFSLDNPSKGVKRLFCPMPGLQPDNPHYDKRRNSIVVSLDDMKSLFAPVVEKIMNMMQDQVDGALKTENTEIKTIVLVGGFSACPYVWETVKKWCSQRQIRLTTPAEGGWSAIVRGAVIRGLNGNIVTQKKCRKHYGVRFSKRYDPDVHGNLGDPKAGTYVDPWDGLLYQNDLMGWKFAKGSVIDQTTEMTQTVDKVYFEGNEKTLYTNLYACGRDEAPRTSTSAQVEKVGTVRYDISQLDLSQLECRTDPNGKKMWSIEREVRIRLADTNGLLAVRVLHHGMEIGKAELDVLDL